MYILHSYTEDYEVKYLVTDNLKEASDFFLKNVCGDDKEIPYWVIESPLKYLSDDKWNIYAGMLKYCIERGVPQEMLARFYPEKINGILEAQPIHFNNFLNAKLYCREAGWLLCCLFLHANITLMEDELFAMSKIIMDIGDGPSYPHVLVSSEMSGTFEV